MIFLDFFEFLLGYFFGEFSNFTGFLWISIFKVYFEDGIYLPPSKCMKKGNFCKGKTFVPLKDKVQTTFTQRVKVQ